MTDPNVLRPASRRVPDPEGGWQGRDLSDDELVDDLFIENDPSSHVVEPEQED
jgi:hypothetical protein